MEKVAKRLGWDQQLLQERVFFITAVCQQLLALLTCMLQSVQSVVPNRSPNTGIQKLKKINKFF